MTIGKLRLVRVDGEWRIINREAAVWPLDRRASLAPQDLGRIEPRRPARRHVDGQQRRH